MSEGGRRCRPQRPSKDRWPREAGEGGEGTFAAAQLSAIMIVMNMYDFVGGRGRRGATREDDEARAEAQFERPRSVAERIVRGPHRPSVW